MWYLCTEMSEEDYSLRKFVTTQKRIPSWNPFLLYVNSFDFLKWNVCSDAGAFMQCVIIGNKDGFRVRETLN